MIDSPDCKEEYLCTRERRKNRAREKMENGISQRQPELYLHLCDLLGKMCSFG